MSGFAKAIFRLAYHYGLRESEVGMIQMEHWRLGTSSHLDGLFLHRLKGSIAGETVLVSAASTALREWVRVRGLA